MDSDEDRDDALADGAIAVVLRVRDVSEEKQGTRSATTAYAVDVVEGAAPAQLVIKHFGTPLLAAGVTYDAAIEDSGRFHGAWQVRFARARR
jgi:hypothetical protein